MKSLSVRENIAGGIYTPTWYESSFLHYHILQQDIKRCNFKWQRSASQVRSWEVHCFWHFFRCTDNSSSHFNEKKYWQFPPRMNCKANWRTEIQENDANKTSLRENDKRKVIWTVGETVLFMTTTKIRKNDWLLSDRKRRARQLCSSFDTVMKGVCQIIFVLELLSWFALSRWSDAKWRAAMKKAPCFFG